MEDHWTLPLSEEGTRKILEERNERPRETPERLALLRRLRDAARSLERGGTRSLLSDDR